MKKMRKFFALVICFAMLAIAMAGCGKEDRQENREEGSQGQERNEGQEEGAASSSKDTLVIGSDQEPPSLSPLESAGAPSARIRRLVCEGMFKTTEDGEYEPLLATSWEWEDDVTLVFHLREGVHFSDGTPFTADDVIFTLEIKTSGGDVLANYVKSFEKIDDYTVKILFTEPNAFCFDKFESQHFPVVNRAAYEADGNEFAYNLIGTGPYTLENWTTGETLTLKRNEDYWGTAAKIENVEFRFITESSQRTIEMETGGIDFACNVPALDLDYFTSEEYSVYEDTDEFITELFFNLDSDIRESPVQDPRVRQAIAYAFDTESLLETYFNGIGVVPTSNVNPCYGGIYEEGGEVLYKYDLEKAKSLMKEAGYENGFKIVCLANETQREQDLTEILSAALDPLHIEVEILIRNSTTWFDTVVAKEEWDICWFSLGDADPVFAFMHFLGDSENFGVPDYTHYRNEEFTAALLEASKTNDTERHKELFTIMNQCMIDDLPMYSVYVPVVIVVANSDLCGFESRSGCYNIEAMYFK